MASDPEKRIKDLEALIAVYEATVYVLGKGTQGWGLLELDDAQQSQLNACDKAHQEVMGEESAFIRKIWSETQAVG